RPLTDGTVRAAPLAQPQIGAAMREQSVVPQIAPSMVLKQTMPVRPIGINHIAFEVRDLDEALEWYGRYFDFTLRGRRATMAWIDLGDQFLALSESHGANDEDRGRHVGFVVDDKEALRQALKQGGEDVASSGSLRVRDPSGNQ